MTQPKDKSLRGMVQLENELVRQGAYMFDFLRKALITHEVFDGQ